MGNSTSCLCNADKDVQEERGQLHLLYSKKTSPPKLPVRYHDQHHVHQPTRLVVQNDSDGGSHIFAVRNVAEQRPHLNKEIQEEEPPPVLNPAELFSPYYMAHAPRTSVSEFVPVSKELEIYICDTGLTPGQCNSLVSLTEHVCRGQYAAYTYAKQTLGCREFPLLAGECFPVVHRITHAIQTHLSKGLSLKLDEREPHMVKYDISKKERQKLDMHTDKSEWTFLIAMSDGSGLDYEGGGTYFEALQATVHVQRGHALIFPGKLRHCGQRITKGVRFLLVGFLVDANKHPPRNKEKEA